MKKATALLLNWKRPDNLKEVIASLRAQNVAIEIFLWNNNQQDPTRYDVDLQIDASHNMMCWPRWFLANYAHSEYIFSLDDDILLVDTEVIADSIEYVKKHQASIGYSGVVLNSEHSYWDSKHIHYPKRSADVEVDIIKGKFMFHHISSLATLQMFPQRDIQQYDTRIEDDIVVSSLLQKKIIPAFLRGRFRELTSNDALFDQSDHELSRQEATRRYFTE